MPLWIGIPMLGIMLASAIVLLYTLATIDPPARPTCPPGQIVVYADRQPYCLVGTPATRGLR